MRGKVKEVKRSEWHVATQQNWPLHDVHATRATNTYAVLYDGKNVSIDEDDIRRFYGCQRITEACIAKLSNDLHNKEIEYTTDGDGDYCLVGSISQYI